MDRHNESSEGRILDDQIENERRIHRMFRNRATAGGACIGMILGAVLGGPYLKDWQDPLRSYSLAIFGTGAFGALTGFLFREIIVARLSVGGSARGASDQNESPSSNESHPYEDD